MIGALRHGLIEPADFARPVDLDLQPLVLEVELALEPVHDLVGDRRPRCAGARSRAAAPPAPRARSSGRRPSGPRSRRPRSCPPAPPAGACGTRTAPRMRSIVSSRVHSSPASSSIRASAALVATQPRLELLVRLLACRRRCTPSARISGGSVSPCSTSVAKITANVRKMIRSRCGKSAASASAAASETAPRMPAQPIDRSARCQVAAARAHATRAGRARGSTNTIVCCQTSRVSTTAALTAARVAEQRRRSRRRSSASRIAGSCRPISTNRNALSRNCSSSHMPKPCSRVAGEAIFGACQPT